MKFVYDGIGKEGLWKEFEGRIYLGDTQFTQEVEAWADRDLVSKEVPLIQPTASMPKLEQLCDKTTLKCKKKRNNRIVEAFQKHL